MAETKIDRIDISVGEKKLSLTPDEARELKDILCGLFGEKVTYLPYPVYRESFPWWEYQWWKPSIYTGTSVNILSLSGPLEPPKETYDAYTAVPVSTSAAVVPGQHLR